MTERGDDQRQGVTEGVHRVLDVLDRCRPGWARLPFDHLDAEMRLITGDAGRRWLTTAECVRLAALTLHMIERVTEEIDG